MHLKKYLVEISYPIFANTTGGDGMDRGDAADKAMSDYHMNYLAIPECLLTGDMKIHFV